MKRKKVIIIGGGFGGLNAAIKLGRSEFDVLVIDKTNHHLFQPLLYQVASAALSPSDIAAPIREILDNYENIEVIMGNVVEIDKSKSQITLESNNSYHFDYLIVATGARHSYFGNDEWEKFAPGLKSLNDAIDIRERVLLAFEWAERCDDPEEVKRALRFVIIGGGPTGVELAGAISEIAHKALFRNFRKIKPEHSEIYLIEGSDRLLHAYPPDLSERAKSDLEKMGIKIILGTHVTKISDTGVEYGDTTIEAENVLWAAGNQASPLLKTLDVPLDRAGRVIVNPNLSIPDHEHIYVIGDAANCSDGEGKPLPGLASVAIQQGEYVAKLLKKGIQKPFHYFDKGSLATIGKAKAVGVIGKMELKGFFAWLIWSFIHIVYLVSMSNRIRVITQWISTYIFGARHVRLIRRPLKPHPLANTEGQGNKASR